jgi:hypothetical protein
MFTNLLANSFLKTKSALLCNDLQQWGFLRLPCLHQGQLSHNSLSFGDWSVWLQTLSNLSTRTDWLQSQSYVTTNSWQVYPGAKPYLGPRPDYRYGKIVVDFLMWATLSGEKAGLSFTAAAGPCQCCHFQVQVLQDCFKFETPQPEEPGPQFYFPKEQGGRYTPRHLVPFLLPPMTCRAMVEEFEPTFTQDTDWLLFQVSRYSLCMNPTANTFPQVMCVTWYHMFHCSGTAYLVPDCNTTSHSSLTVA